MKMRYTYIFFLISYLFSSMLEVYGTGENCNQVGAQGIGMGNIYFFSDYSNGLNTSSIATFSKSNLTRVNFAPQFSSNIGGMDDKDITVSSFSFSFPVGKSKAVSFGLSPYTRSEIRLLESNGYTISQNSSNFIDHALNSYSEYQFYGGISNFSTSLSVGLGENNNFAFKFNTLFGNQIQMDKIVVSTFDAFNDSTEYNFVEQDSTSKVVLNQFSGYSIQFDWMSKINKHEFGISVTSMGPMNVFYRKYYDMYIYPDQYNPYERYFMNLTSGDDLLSYDPYYSKNIKEDIKFIPNILSRIDDIKLGYHYQIDNRGIVFELHKDGMFQNSSLQVNDVNILNNSKPQSVSYHFGYYSRYDNSRISFFNSINLRLGAYYKEYDFDSSEEATDFALTFGIGFAINDYLNLIDVGVRVGQRNYTLFETENYITGNLSINIGERWFLR